MRGFTHGLSMGLVVGLCCIVVCSSIQTPMRVSCSPLHLGGRGELKPQLSLRLSGGGDVDGGDAEMEAPKDDSPKSPGSKKKKKKSVSGKRKGEVGGTPQDEGVDDKAESGSPRKKLQGKEAASAKKNPTKFSKRLKELVEKLSTTTHFTVEEPGEWEGKEETHVPTAEAVEDGIKVTVQHVMNDEADDQPLHYIEFIWIIDKATGEHLDIKQLFPTDEEASAVFTGDYAGKEVVPYAMCNLHGIWRGSVLAVQL